MTDTAPSGERPDRGSVPPAAPSSWSRARRPVKAGLPRKVGGAGAAGEGAAPAGAGSRGRREGVCDGGDCAEERRGWGGACCPCSRHVRLPRSVRAGAGAQPRCCSRTCVSACVRVFTQPRGVGMFDVSVRQPHRAAWRMRVGERQARSQPRVPAAPGFVCSICQRPRGPRPSPAPSAVHIQY